MKDNIFKDFFNPGDDLSDLARGIELPHGLGVYVTEIVNSQTGVWVGFIPDSEDDLIEFKEIGKDVTKTKMEEIYKIIINKL